MKWVLFGGGRTAHVCLLHGASTLLVHGRQNEWKGQIEGE